MKKKLRNILALCCTLLLLAFGVLMPRLTSSVLDRRLAQEVLQRENAAVSLVLAQELDFLQALALFSAQTTQVELSGGSRMTAEEAAAAAIDALLELPTATAVFAAPEATPYLVTDRDVPGRSAVFWRCAWDGDDGKEVLWLDDQTGRMVAYQGRTGMSKSFAVPSDGTVPEAVSKIVDYCRKYYPVQDASVEAAEQDGAYRVLLVEAGKQGESAALTYTIPLRLWDNWIYFNL